MSIIRASGGDDSVILPEDENVTETWVYIDKFDIGDGGNGCAFGDSVSKDLFHKRTSRSLHQRRRRLRFDNFTRSIEGYYIDIVRFVRV